MSQTFNSTEKTSLKYAAVCVALFILLSAFPIVKIHALWITIPLYCGILAVLWFAAKAGKPGKYILFTAAALASLALLAVYGYYLIPRKAAISLGTAAVSGGVASKVLFAISGLFALASIGYFFWKFCRSETARR